MSISELNSATEAVAKTRWCPAVRAAHGAWTGFNRFQSGAGDDVCVPTLSKCIGSACMAWRWRSAGTVTTDDHVKISEDSTGYCGAYGAP